MDIFFWVISSTANAMAIMEPKVISIMVPLPPVEGSSTPLLFSTVVEVAV